MPESKAVQARQLPQPLVVSLQADMSSIGKLLPADVTLEHFKAAVWLYLTSNTGLHRCSAESIMQGIIRAANAGLVPGRDCVLVPFKGQATYIEMYQGKLRRLDRTGKVRKAFANVVYSGDTFEVDFLADQFSHKPGYDRRAVKAYYACIVRTDGTQHVEVMTPEEVDAIRKRSRAGEDGPWATDYHEMAKKTVMHRLCKYVQLIPQDEYEVAPPSITDDTAQRHIVDLYGAVGQEMRARGQARLEEVRARQELDAETVDMTTGEIVEDVAPTDAPADSDELQF